MICLWIRGLFIVLIISIIPQNAFAYIDPGTGSYIIQIIIAALVGGLFAIKMFWIKIKTFITSMFKKKTEDSEQVND